MTSTPNTRASLIHAQREIGLRGGLHRFIRMAWPIVEPGAPFVDNWSIGAAAEHLEAVHRGQIRRLILNQPPGTMKSLTTCVFWPVWSWIQDAGSRWFFASFDGELTRRDSGRALRIIQSDWFRERWGNRVALRSKDPAVGYYETLQGGLRFASSVQGRAMGRAHPDYQVIDDPIKPKAISKNTLEETKEWIRGTMASRWRDVATGRRVLIMQRLHEDDLAGYLMAEGGYEVVRLPMRYEAANPCVTCLGTVDPRTEEGDLLWPSRFPEEGVTSLERDMGPAVAAAQLQQRPTPAGGLVFHKGWFGYWVTPGFPTDHLPFGKWRVIPDRFDLEILSWDMAFKETATSDFVVGQAWGRKGGEFYCVDQVRDRADLPKTLAMFTDLAARRPRAIAKLVEDKANGPAVISTLKGTVPGIIPVTPAGGKEARANAVAPLYHAGNVFWPDPKMGSEYAWVTYAIGEHTSFPFAKHDDAVDAATQALGYMQDSTAIFVAAMRRLRERG